MKTRLLKKLRKNYRIKKITRLNGDVFFKIQKRFKLFFLFPIWNNIHREDIFPIVILSNKAICYKYVFEKMKKIFHQKYYKYSRKYIVANTSKKDEIVWYK
ncbi:MAG TPA: hypothetical protein GX708_13040 [Gallicola sp.]|nr:hypothetical protein [Gallicola sp.]